MKKILKNILILFSVTTFLVSCDKEDFTVLNPEANTTVSLSASEVVLLPENIDLEALLVSWTDPDYGYDAGADYQITFTNGDQSSTVSAGTDLSKAFETIELNKILLGIGVEGDTPTQIDVMITIVLSEYKKISSNTTMFTVTAYEDKLDLSTDWTMIGDAITGVSEDWSVDVPMYQTETTDVFVAYVMLYAKEVATDLSFKFRKDLGWDVNYGGSDGKLVASGDNIKITEDGNYKVVIDLANLTYTVELYSWGIVGDATPIGWPGDTTPPDEQLVYDSYSDTWKVVIKLSDGLIKFRANNDWTLNYGDDGADGVLDPSGSDIAVTAGNYIVTVDFKTLEYTLDEIPHIWGITGGATPIGWPANPQVIPDAKLSPDFSTDDIWVIKSFPLTSDKIKFRADDSWDLNYGDTGADGILNAGGDDIAVTEGLYDIYLDFSNPDTPTYTLTAL